MRALVATNDTQGSVQGDYAWTVEGELVIAEVVQCDSPGDCGCSRGFPGLASGKATTTAMVADLPHLTVSDLAGAIEDWLERSGWADLFRHPHESDPDAEHERVDGEEMIDAIVSEHIENVVTICGAFPVGTIVERNGASITMRDARRAA